MTQVNISKVKIQHLVRIINYFNFNSITDNINFFTCIKNKILNIVDLSDLWNNRCALKCLCFKKNKCCVIWPRRHMPAHDLAYNWVSYMHSSYYKGISPNILLMFTISYGIGIPTIVVDKGKICIYVSLHQNNYNCKVEYLW